MWGDGRKMLKPKAFGRLDGRVVIDPAGAPVSPTYFCSTRVAPSRGSGLSGRRVRGAIASLTDCGAAWSPRRAAPITALCGNAL